MRSAALVALAAVGCASPTMPFGVPAESETVTWWPGMLADPATQPLSPGHYPNAARVIWTAVKVERPTDLLSARFQTGPFVGGVHDAEGQVLAATLERDEYGRPVPGKITAASEGRLFRQNSTYSVDLRTTLGPGTHLIGIYLFAHDADENGYATVMLWGDAETTDKVIEATTKYGSWRCSGVITQESPADYIQAGSQWTGEYVAYSVRHPAIELTARKP